MSFLFLQCACGHTHRRALHKLQFSSLVEVWFPSFALLSELASDTADDFDAKTLGVDPYWSVVWQCQNWPCSVLLIIHFLLSLFHLLVLCKPFEMRPVGVSSLLVAGKSVVSLLPISSLGLRPYQGKGGAW